MFDDMVLGTGSDDADNLPILPITGDDNSKSFDVPELLPILVLKNTALFPGIVIPITVAREKSLKAVNEAFKKDKIIAVITQKDPSVEEPAFEDLFRIGTVARILKVLKMPDGSVTAVLQGKRRYSLIGITAEEPYLMGQVQELHYKKSKDELEFSAQLASIRENAQKIIKLSPNLPNEASLVLQNIESEDFLLDFISSNLAVPVARKQEILSLSDMQEKANIILEEMSRELQMLEIKDQIESKVKGDIEKQQRQYLLNQQLKTIQDELGQNPQAEELSEMEQKAKKMDWPEAAAKTFEKTLTKIKRMNPQVAEYSVTMNYLELLLELPWNRTSKDNYDLIKVQKILDEDHFGLKKVKERILEHLAVLKLKKDMKAPILCLVGPPGVGKTSLGKSIARALDRKFVRMSLGGVHDESEIRGHRKTYIGAMPGRIVKAIKKADTSNPVFILDEIDKIGKNHRGDPSSALLEVLDPEQNTRFHDNYLEIEYDLSKVLFIATANSLNTIQPALLDRMEIIKIEGYSQEEKLEIAKKHLIPKQRKAHGLKGTQVKLGDKTINKIIADYTRESGVRSLDRKLAGVMRNTAMKVATEADYQKSIKAENLNDILGPKSFSKEKYIQSETPGVAVGLAWTRVGGDILFIESSLNKGKGKLTLTGNLGDVMKESATTALSFIKANADKLNIDDSVFTENDIHIHVPAGAIPKDGPSAGITLLSSLASAFTKKPLKPFVAMTGEITLRGMVLPVGGIKEKILAAKRAGIKQIILCEENRRHIDQIEDQYLFGLEFVYVSRMEQVLQFALGVWDF